MMSSTSASGGRNRLATSKSPYLLQHANNPVDWYPWGEEAFEAARQQNKPVFLSIGYSTCHWCHVMAHESFEDVETAKAMNESFVNVKVDREERPDIDRQYMLFVQATTGGGGWPLSVFLTPQRIPFFGGTYFGKDEAPGRPAFRAILSIIADRWKADARGIASSGSQVVQKLRQKTDFIVSSSDRSGELARVRSVQKAFLQLHDSFDTQYGGIGTGTKFAMPSALEMLLNYTVLWRELERDTSVPPLQEIRRSVGVAKMDKDLGSEVDDDAKAREVWKETVAGGVKMANVALEMVNKTLNSIAKGGMYDHLGGGFHRYSVDRAWTLPHFEKMLYDQAQLLKVFAEAWALNGRQQDSLLEKVVHETVGYCRERLMDSSTGAFFAAEDADSLDPASGKTVEGSWAVWTDSEINQTLRDADWSDADIKLFKYHFTVLPRGNIRGLTHDQELSDKNVLLARNPVEVSAQKQNVSLDKAQDLIAQGKRLLKQQRDKRPRPHRDEKIICGWNGLMLSGLSAAARIFQNEEYLAMAKRLAAFLTTQMTQTVFDSAVGNEEPGVANEYLVLWRYFADGKPVESVDAFADDYTMVIGGLIDLYCATLDSSFLETAEALQRSFDVMFRDRAGFGYFSCPRMVIGKKRAAVDEPLIPIKDDHDGVEPSANSLAAHNCLRLYHLTGRKVYMDRFKQLLRLFTKHLDQEPHSMTTLVSALILDIVKMKVVVMSQTPEKSVQARKLFNAIGGTYAPHILVQVKPEPEHTDFRTHVCQGSTCSAPSANVEDLLANRLHIA